MLTIYFVLTAISLFTIANSQDCSDSHYLCGEFRRRYPIGSADWLRKCYSYQWARTCKVCTMFCNGEKTSTTTTTSTTPTTTTKTTTTQSPITKSTTTTATSATEKPTRTSTTTTTKTPIALTTTSTMATKTSVPTTKSTTTFIINPGDACGDRSSWCHIIAKNKAEYCGKHASDCIRTCGVCNSPQTDICLNLQDEPGYNCNIVNCKDSDKLNQFRAKTFCSKTCCLRNEFY